MLKDEYVFNKTLDTIIPDNSPIKSIIKGIPKSNSVIEIIVNKLI